MALSLTLSDLADGTGATATVAGADNATVTVYTMAAGASSWTSSGSRTGNGTLALSLSPNYYFGYAQGTVSGSPAVSPVTGLVAVTSGTQAVADQVLDAV